MNRYLEKIAAELKEHQLRANDKLMEEKGVLLNHSTGSGKTMTILEAIRRIQEKHPDTKQLVITPASLTSNIKKEMDKHNLKIDQDLVETISYDKAVNNVSRLLDNKYSLVSVDEAHKLRNTGTKRFRDLNNLIEKADYKMLATATPLYNSPSDISPLINMLAGYKALPTERKDFEKKYISLTPEVKSVPEQKKNWLMKILTGPPKPAVVGKPAEVNLTRSDELKDILSRYVDTYHLKDDPEAKNYFPSSKEETITVSMSPEQEQVYKYLERDIPKHIRVKIQQNLPLDKAEAAQLNAFSTGVRQASNSIMPYDKTGNVEVSPKILRATEELHNKQSSTPNFKAVVYSNYLKAGLEDYARVLDNQGVSYHMYNGSMNSKEKDIAVKDYNAGKVPVLLISSSGAEGLDLKGTKLIQVLEPHFNNSKIAQITGRGIRFKSHEHLPEEERHVDVQHFLSAYMPDENGPKKEKTIDQYLKENSVGKDIIVDKIQGLLKTSSRRSLFLPKKRSAEEMLETASTMKDTHDKYKSGKKQYKKLVKRTKNDYK